MANPADNFADRSVTQVQLDRTPFYRRRRVPESFNLKTFPEFGNMTNTSFIGPYKAWSIVTVGQTFTPNDPYVNAVTLGSCLYTAFGNGDGLWTGVNLGFPIMFQGFAGSNLTQEFRLWASVPYQGQGVTFDVSCPVYAFRVYNYGTQLPWINYSSLGSVWSADGDLIVTLN